MNPEQHDAERGDLVAVLVRAGGRREAPPPEAYRIVLAAAEAALQEKLRRRRLRHFGWALAAAAVVSMFAVGLSQRITPRAPVPLAASVALVDRMQGRVEIRPAPDAAWTVLDAQRPLASESRVRTGPGSGAGLLLQQRLSLRIAAETEIELTDPERIRLVHGAIYVDAQPDGTDRLIVATPLGEASHRGTQFELRYQPSRLQVLVREGRVLVARESGPLEVAAGEGVVVTEAGDVETVAIAPHDPVWQWTQSLAPVPDFDERPAGELLSWVARQTGRRLQYVTPQAEQRAAAIILRGNFAGMAPLEALEVTRATTDLVVDLQEDGRVLVGTR